MYKFQILIQAEDRVYRIGQLETVPIQYILARGTVDDQLWPMIQSKLDIQNEVKLDFSKDDSVKNINTTFSVSIYSIYIYIIFVYSIIYLKFISLLIRTILLSQVKLICLTILTMKMIQMKMI